jgi:predicted O-methyltransferase YrrM
LELGVYDNSNFNRISASRKVGVDINGLATINCYTDEYFKNYLERFDIIFIDADHKLESVVQDFNNSIDVCDKIIFLHDMIPPNEAYCSDGYCSNSFNLLAHFLKNHITIYTLDRDVGITAITKKDFQKISIDDIEQLSFTEFRNIMSGVKLYTPIEMIDKLNEEITDV